MWCFVQVLRGAIIFSQHKLCVMTKWTGNKAQPAWRCVIITARKRHQSWGKKCFPSEKPAKYQSHATRGQSDADIENDDENVSDMTQTEMFMDKVMF